MRMYLVSKTCPTSTAGFIASNLPMLHVHVSVFDDLTLIGITTSQMVFDAPGISTFLYSWTRVISGHNLDEIPGMEWDLAPFESFCPPTTLNYSVRGYAYLTPAQSPIVMGDPILSKLLSWVRNRLDPEVSQLIRVPKAFLEDQRRQIMEELKQEGSTEWVSSSDVLMAWWFKVRLFI
jgi:hypothetical protein